MTILTPVSAPVVRPVPWTRLAWVTWRRYRATLLGVLGILVVLGVDLVLTGAQARSSYAAAAACTPADSASCHFGWDTFHHTYAQTGLVGVILVFLPGIIGVFAGGPALARELETGTFRYAWTQGVGRMRWAVAVVVPGVLAAAAIVGAFGVLVSWHNQPLVDSGEFQRLHTTVFPVTGIACAGWAMVGFGLGVLAGLLWRRVLPALVTAFAAWFGLAYLAAQLRVHYLAALTTTSLNLSNSDLTLDQWFTKGGQRASDTQINSVLESIGAQTDPSGKVTGGGVDAIQYLLAHGYQQVTSYQPDGRFWTYQWIEFGWLTALTLLTLGVTFWLLRRRPA